MTLRRAVVALAGVLWAARAGADVEIVPALDGSLGAWWATGPRAASPDGADVTPGAGSAWRLIASADGAIDLKRSFGLGRGSNGRVVVGGTLVLPRALDGWLLVSAEGQPALFVDGQRTWRRALPATDRRALDAVPLRLAAGAHAIALELPHFGGEQGLAVRLLEQSTLLPPDGATLRLVGADDAAARRLTLELSSVVVDAGAGEQGYRPQVRLRFERGVPRGGALPVQVTMRVAAGPAERISLGHVAVGGRGVAPLEATLLPVWRSELKQRTTLRVELQAGPIEHRADLDLDPRVADALGRARAARETLTGQTTMLDEAVIRAGLEHAERRLAEGASRVGQRHDAELGALEALAAEVLAGRDPLRRAGTVQLARRSAVDGELDAIRVQVPVSFAQAAGADRERGAKASSQQRRWPLVVALHGLNGTPKGILDAYLDDTSGRAVVDGFVLAPNARGNAFYRGPGEREVLDAIDWALAKLPVDRDRIAITGVSMGGTGSAQIALRHTERFAAAAPLCGYHSYWVRRDTGGRPLRAWERDRMNHWSTVSSADSGRHLPLWVAHGLRDHPLANSRVLVDRYRELGYAITDEWPDTGHSVWTKTYAGARLHGWLTAQRRASNPSRVTLAATSLAHARAHWLRVTRFARSGARARIDAEVEAPRRIVVRTELVDAFVLTRPIPGLESTGTVTLVVDGTPLPFDASQPLAVRRTDGAWRRADDGPLPGEKRPGVEGPVRDVFEGPVTFVWGSGRAQTARANREVAQALASTRGGPEMRYPVIADVELDDELEAKTALVLVGTPADHRLLRALDARLPIGVVAGAIRIGDRRISAAHAGAIFAHPNPRHPQRLLVVVTGVDAAGIWWALSLPELLPDFLVYDHALAPAAGEQVLGSARVLAGGFFDPDWQLPSDTADRPGPPRDLLP